MPASHEIHRQLLPSNPQQDLINSAFHKEIFYYHLGLTNPDHLTEYENKKCVAELLGSDEHYLNTNLLQKSKKSLPIELFSLLRTNRDVTVEYSSGDELRKIRQSYLVHVLDHLIQERERIFINDMKEYEENNKNKLTLNNVFEIA